MRLRRSDLSKPGYGRKGSRLLDTSGAPLRSRSDLDRIKSLVIPPAWKDVWISPDPRGHIQATGVDDAGRKQYLYHPAWREQQDRAKFDHALSVASRLPDVRDRLDSALTGRGLTRDRVLAAVVRLLDMGMFRVGGEDSAAREEDPSFGLSTLRPEHLRGRGGCVLLEFTGKSGVSHAATVGDGEVCAVLRDLKRRRRGEERLFAYWDPSRRRWQEVRADMINEYLREISGEQMTAKDFRTWQGTVEAASSLAAAGPQLTKAKRKKAVAQASRDVASLLGNTPTVARNSYIDPRVIEHFEEGRVAEVPEDAPRERVEEEVRELLAGDTA
ncbi:DNA topoisomerase IB [Actinoplanes sp. NPDC051861]|uniref:DNA topoisomerase IB n=1 Tax=Actinoplanes sp. NPDC051861 TaxID=3155170 RepID=UPI00342E3406